MVLETSRATGDAVACGATSPDVVPFPARATVATVGAEDCGYETAGGGEETRWAVV
jgi:hypothetical protein